MKLIECVPNFSEGRNREVIDAITAEIAGTDGAMLLDVDPGMATNRTVVTFIGHPDAVVEAAFRAIAKAAELIDMSSHSGEHARMGATDVCPFVPVRGATMEDCVELANRLAERVGNELEIPVFLYGHAATRPERRRLPDIRKGEYEALPDKLVQPDFQPDYGPARFNARSGATAIGAREFLIAWNVNLNTRERKLANKIAAELRQTGKLKRDELGKIVRDADGRALRVPGRFQELQGAGWYIEEYGRAQISFNLTNYNVTPLQAVFDACREEAQKIGVRITGSELVGLVPLEALLQAGNHYLAKQGRSTGIPEAERVHIAVLSLGLDDLSAFQPAEKIVEYKYQGQPSGLTSMRVTAFADELSSDSPAPGGGSVAALCGSMSAALASMVAALTWSKKGMEETRPTMQRIGERGQALKDFFLQAVERDTEAFNQVIAARRLPKKTSQEQEARQRAVQQANEIATRVPLEVLEKSTEALSLALEVARQGNPNSVSDAGVAGACARAAAEGAALNVRINLPSLSDETLRAKLLRQQTELLETAYRRADQVRAAVDEILERET
jgi:glutamate formiminotransferase/formiminotetrahydrofolate cyclodeaminase